MSTSGRAPDDPAQEWLRLLSEREPSWLTLPPSKIELPRELTAAIDAFDAGERQAARAASDWLRKEAHASYDTARTRLLVADGRVLGFYALASAQVALSTEQRARSFGGVPHVSIAASLVAWMAKAAGAQVDGRELLLHAVATARRASVLQATAVLVVDPFDEETGEMWQQRFGFRRSAEKRRLWLSLTPA